MLTRSITLTEQEAEDLRYYAANAGEVEDAALKRAALRGLRELRIEQALRAYAERGDSSEAAEIAGMPRAEFLQLLIDRGITMLDGPSTLVRALEFAADQLGSERLAELARALPRSDD